MIHDIPTESANESTYECLQCGDLVTAPVHPGVCDSCGSEMQNRAMSLE